MWLSRDKGISFMDDIYLWNKKPNFNGTSYYGTALYAFCLREFKKITGIYLKSGECRKIKSIKIELED